jgi:ABC-type polysaccharide/polyol phosphate transport system ATPase subunit
VAEQTERVGVADTGPVTTRTPEGDRIPTVVVDDVHVVYRVYGAGSPGSGTPVAGLRRMLTGKRSPAIREVHAIKGASFTAYRGEAVGLIGSNGSGKSTILRAIAGLLPVDRGAIYTMGQPSLLGVNAALMNDLSGERNVILGCLAMGMSRAQVRELRAEAGTVFLVSHAIATIRDTCERTIWLESGVVRMDGPTDTVVPEYEKYMNRK